MLSQSDTNGVVTLIKLANHMATHEVGFLVVNFSQNLIFRI